MNNNNNIVKKPLVIMELANNHMGDVKHTKNIVSGFNKITQKYRNNIEFAIKFQYRNNETFIHDSFKNSDHSGVKRFESTYLNKKDWKIISSFSKKKYKLICTAFDESSVDRVVNENFDYLKIASCSITDWPLMEKISKTAKNKKIICSLGGGTEKEISNVISFLTSRIKNINFLYCVAMYPTEPKNLNLNYFKYLRDIYGNKIQGFSSHEDPNEHLSGAISYGMGSRIFEKHIALKTNKYSPNKYSVNPEQFDKWLNYLNMSIERVGSLKSRKKNLQIEINQLRNFKRGVYLKKNVNLKTGQEIKKKHVLFQYPSIKGQLLANDFSKFSKFVLKKNIDGSIPLLKKNIKLFNNRGIVEEIREKIKEMISKSKTVVPPLSEIEISHHYGIENFKKFGLTMITIFNKDYCKKLLFLLSNQVHPKQFHKIKNETFFILYGKVKVKIWSKGKLSEKILKAGDLLTIHPREVHWFKSVSKTGSIIEELSTESRVSDSYYLDSKITKNKNRKSFISLN
tara:strand:+ start:1201 stop:2739 length:1539 start_codon:yes stop_codon:yes gene_type:complete